MALSVLFATVLPTANAHGNLVFPPTWYNPSGSNARPYQQCYGGACLWFTNYTFVSNPTMRADSPMRTYAGTDPDYTYLENNPWGAPGKAVVWSPCGIHGGNPMGCPFGDLSSTGQECPFGGFGYGDDAREVYDTPKWQTLAGGSGNKTSTTWKAGAIVEAAWAIKANHGGGYNYRLCKVPAGNKGAWAVTEECFQDGSLKFHGDKQWLQRGFDKRSRVEIPAVRSCEGTWPKGSQWTRNPVPACKAPGGGVFHDTSNACKMSGGQTQFKPPAPGIQGFGTYFKISTDRAFFGFNIVDQLEIPKNLEPGKYVLSHRWDVEQTSQVWTTCADITIVA